jgi:CxxC-x17-CxxC domain-containing protein
MKKQLKNEADIFGLMTRIQEQLTALDRKVDSLINKPLPQPMAVRPAPKPFFQQSNNSQVHGSGRQNDHHNGRPMFRATCADCKKECELPFRPTGDRPVYCKECFQRRKVGNTLKVTTDYKPKDALPVQSVIKAAVNIPQPPAKEKRKSSKTKRSGGKNRLVSQKKKK